MFSFVIALLALGVLVVILAMIMGSTDQGATPFIKEGLPVGRYLAGHPDIDSFTGTVRIFEGQDCFRIVAIGLFNHPEKLLGIIPFESIKEVLVEDRTTIERRVTVTRMLAVGLFAFALKKKEKHQQAYLTIEWQKERFNHETIFQFEEDQAIERANAARNRLVKALTKASGARV